MEADWHWKNLKINYKKEGNFMNYGKFGGQYVPQELKNKLSQEFSDIILVFDFEPQQDIPRFNLIRKLNGKYDGRCFYLNLKDNMHTLEKSLKNIC